MQKICLRYSFKCSLQGNILCEHLNTCSFALTVLSSLTRYFHIEFNLQHAPCLLYISLFSSYLFIFHIAAMMFLMCENELWARRHMAAEFTIFSNYQICFYNDVYAEKVRRFKFFRTIQARP